MLDGMRTEIERLRGTASPLEPDADARRELGGQALDHVLAYLDQVETASSNRPWSEVFAQRLDPEFDEQGRDPERVLD
jgi:aromatic-L-amino-acid decarboxylase